MALPFIFLHDESSDSEPRFTLEVNEKAKDELLNNFSEFHSVLPVLFLIQSDTGLSSMLRTLIKASSKPFLSETDLFSFDAPSEDSVLVWPYPIEVKGEQLLVMKMWEFDLLDCDERITATRKALYSLLSITAFCFMSVSRRRQFQELEFVQSLYEEMKMRRGLQMCEFLIFQADHQASISVLKSQETIYSSKPYLQYTSFLPISEAADTEKLFKQLFRKGNFMNFFVSHVQQSNISQQKLVFINLLWAILRIPLRVAKADLSFEYFLENVPRFDDPALDLYQNKLEKLEIEQQFLENSTAQPLFVQNSPTTYAFNASLLETIYSTFDQTKQTVIFVVLGSQGLGMSTFLNHIVRHCLKKPKVATYFQAERAVGHATKGSQTLSCPLSIPGSESQLMVIDLEGLGGMETQNYEGNMLQHNLIASILTIASVPCMFVKNEQQHQLIIEGFIERIVHLAKIFSFKLERIHFLFHDKDMTDSRDLENEYMSAWVDRLNHSFFSSQKVIRLMNKPNFVDPTKADKREVFLSKFLQDIDYPKRNASGSRLTMREIITQLLFVSQNTISKLNEEYFSHAEREVLHARSGTLLKMIDKLAESVTSDGRNSLVSQFSEKVRTLIADFENYRESERIKSYLRIVIDGKIRQCRLQLLNVESDFAIVQLSTNSQLESITNAHLAQYYSQTWSLTSFHQKCDHLKERLDKVASCYPSIVMKLLKTTKYLDEQRYVYRNSYIGLIFTRGIIAGGLAAIGIAKNCYLLGIPAIIVAIFHRSDSTCQPADWFFAISNYSVTFNDEAITRLRNGRNKSVILVLTRRDLPTTALLNIAVKEASQLTTPELKEFSEDGKAEVISYMRPGNMTENVVILLKLEANTIRSEPILEMIATSMFVRVSFVCLVDNRESQMAVNLVSTTKDEKARVELPKIAIFLAKNVRDGFKQQINAKLGSLHATGQFEEVDSFDAEERIKVQLALREAMGESKTISQQDFNKMIAQVRAPFS